MLEKKKIDIQDLKIVAWNDRKHLSDNTQWIPAYRRELSDII